MFRTDPIDLTNSMFSLTASHPVLGRALATLQEMYNPNSWPGIGPWLLTSVARQPYFSFYKLQFEFEQRKMAVI